ncbi:methanogenesis marker 3 protein [Candidatus Methanoliparum sp. LAM-1]|uniref:methyl-coenzyme M reductase-associated protein Mmp3 n=1 Tax=Candidatus Methanoliparum sp. LAM-1 TaxID=2874846 RepID=UPI001E35E398|nr:methanogenesis marker 3 protein [Candidatus Methanoliparum sp. LAM-1]BDC35351.1 hypothetical protein MTLP_00330 [Candidatus Methanoliparum sp. LAM-1]
MKVKINLKEIDLEDRLSILDVIKKSNEIYRDDCIVALVKKIEKKTNEFLVKTSKGKFILAIDESFLDLWLRFYKNFLVKCGWKTRSSIAFGPIDLSFLELKAKKDEYKYKKGDIFISFGGFKTENSFLCFSMNDHEGLYGIPEGYEKIGKIKEDCIKVVSRLDEKDSILNMEGYNSIIKEIEIYKIDQTRAIYLDDNTDAILTFASIHLFEEAPNCVEYFLSKDEIFEVRDVASTFISDGGSSSKNLVNTTLKEENTIYRTKGVITVRNKGRRIGGIYIYRENTPASRSHSVVGEVESGLELIKKADIGDKILMVKDVESLICVGKTNKDAREFLSSRGIKHTMVKEDDDDAIIIEQRPRSTIEAKSLGFITTLAENPEKLCFIELWENDAPESVSYFRGAADMIFNVGKFMISKIDKDKIILDSPVVKKMPLPFENVCRKSEKGTIGITNFRQKSSGTIGIRLTENTTYGPTGEYLEATNIIGKVKKGINQLKNKKRGAIIYFIEVKK